MTTVDLQSLVDAQEQPFLVIDENFAIVAVNHAFERAYATSRERVVGRPCYEFSHHNARPCSELGENCPLARMKESDAPVPSSCLHVHYDDHGRTHHVRLKAYPLKGPRGSLYMGEAVHDLSVQDAHVEGGIRIVGRSPAFLEALEQLHVAAQSDAPVLLMGETGTGKELAASFIHQESARSDGPFFTLDCTSLNEGLFESEMFGHERGAFTGSVGTRKGLFELADGGTLFLDEIGELSFTAQAKLLRAVECGEFRRVGGGRILRANVRTVCATNRDLAECVKAGQFRADLYYRIACLSIRLPSLRRRMEDIPDLAATIVDDINQSSSRRYMLTAEALALLQEYDYPGNVRELRNILLAGAAHSKSRSIDGVEIARALNAGTCALRPQSRLALSSLPDPASSSPATLRDLEAQHIAKLLHQHHGSRRKVAATLGISERTLYRKLNRYKLR